MTFISAESLRDITWQALERAVTRLLMADGYEGVRLVGQTGDQGADILAHKYGKRHLVQVKNWKKPAGSDVVERTLQAVQTFSAAVPIIVSPSGFDGPARARQQSVAGSMRIPLQLWDSAELIRRSSLLADAPYCLRDPRPYQQEAIGALLEAYAHPSRKRALLVMATGLGKTFTAFESLRRIRAKQNVRVLVLAHTNPLVYQLEKAFWPMLRPSEETLVWNGMEKPPLAALQRAPLTFACIDTVSEFIRRGGDLPEYDVILIDECHHVGGSEYGRVLEHTRAGQEHGPFLMGLTATPWRPDGSSLEETFGPPVYSIDMVSGLKNGYLANVEYRVHTDNIKWEALRDLRVGQLTPRGINRTFFIEQWDDAVVRELARAWGEVSRPRAIVFCGTIDHALTMRDRINALGFCRAAAIVSSLGGRAVPGFLKNRILCDFDEGLVDCVCTVDIFNEGLDVPDVNLIVFQRVTHSRRIFVQQLGRGLRLSPDKDKVLVLDFVSDIRRIAADLELKDRLSGGEHDVIRDGRRISLPYNVEFRRADEADPDTETFMREWLDDVAAIQDAGDDAAVLKFPPSIRSGGL